MLKMDTILKRNQCELCVGFYELIPRMLYTHQGMSKEEFTKGNLDIMALGTTFIPRILLDPFSLAVPPSNFQHHQGLSSNLQLSWLALTPHQPPSCPPPLTALPLPTTLHSNSHLRVNTPPKKGRVPASPQPSQF